MTHPITPPPPELVQQWLRERELLDTLPLAHHYLATVAAQWGADQELEACCEWLAERSPGAALTATEVRAARRPKPPSLKEQALMALEDGDTGPGASLTSNEVDIIRRALEQLDD
jgi:hypothetical protein